MPPSPSGPSPVVHEILSYSSPLGPLTLAANPTGRPALVGCWFDGQDHDRCGLSEQVREVDLGTGCRVLALAAAWLDAYFAPMTGQDQATPGRSRSPRRSRSRGQGPVLPRKPRLDPAGSAFRRRVWEMVSEIPYGSTVAYGDLARQVSAEQERASSPRAVGTAVGYNPLLLFIPCHRVLGAGSRLSGYAAGSERKRLLLDMEAQVLRG